MMRDKFSRYQPAVSLQASSSAIRNRFDGYQYSLLAPPAGARPGNAGTGGPYTIRSVAPALRPLVARYGNRCPECTGPLVCGEGGAVCPVCGFTRLAR